jgi:hypothetical protein
MRRGQAGLNQFAMTLWRWRVTQEGKEHHTSRCSELWDLSSISKLVGETPNSATPSSSALARSSLSALNDRAFFVLARARLPAGTDG